MTYKDKTLFVLFIRFIAAGKLRMVTILSVVLDVNIAIEEKISV